MSNDTDTVRAEVKLWRDGELVTQIWEGTREQMDKLQRLVGDRQQRVNDLIDSAFEEETT